ncbi:MAG: thiamine biosynthesis lipoprotein [Candidatus Azotimanducaceae bacterium]|jgi:thiamine biosynthesis lipoprotein
MKSILLLLTVSLSLLLSACDPAQPILLTGNTMGTTYSVKVIDAVDAEQLAEQIETRLLEINQLMSTYLPDSEISRINRLDVGKTMPISTENLAMLSLSRMLFEQSGGKFDVTIGPLVALWGFGPDPIKTEVPPEADISAALALLDFDALEVRDDVLMKSKPVMIDFSAIAKGYGVDELARLVEEAGATNYLVEIGGELRAKGFNQNDLVWRIGIEKPDIQERTPFTSVPLDNLAMATSGDYRNYFEVDGRRYSHTLDPTTGYPIRHNMVSVTVLAETTALADGYATAIDVMGPEAGLELANRQNLPVFVILRVGRDFTTRTSKAFDDYMSAH